MLAEKLRRKRRGKEGSKSLFFSLHSLWPGLWGEKWCNGGAFEGGLQIYGEAEKAKEAPGAINHIVAFPYLLIVFL